MLPKPRLLLLAYSLLAAGVCPAAQLKGLWEFNNSGNLGQATVGSNATLFGTTSSTTGVTAGDGAIDIATGTASYLSVTNPIGANGASGTPTRTNRFTIVLDFMIPDFDDGGADSGNFTGLFDFDNGGSDGDYFIRKQANAAELGVSSVWNYVGAGATTANNGTAGTVRENTWYRLVLTANNGVTNESSVYLNGSLIGNHAVGTIDAVRRSLSTTTALRVLWDNTAGENSRALISNLALYDGRMTATEVTALGAPGTSLVPVNQAPVITEGSFYSLIAQRDGPAVSATFHATDADGDPVTWSIPTLPTTGTAVILSQSSAACTISYTPATGQTGIANFVVRAADATGGRDITVQASIIQPSSDPKIFYQENFDAAILQPEITATAQRRMPVGDNTPVWNTLDASGLGLASGPDSFLNTPSQRIVEFTGFNLMCTDFWRNGDDQGRSTAFAPGANVIAVADSDEFADGGGTSVENEFNVFLRTPPFQIPVSADASKMIVSFLSSFRFEGNETSRVRVYHNGGGTPAVTLSVPDNGAAAAAPVTFTWAELGSPAPGTVILLEFAHEGGDNNWWWAIDDIFVGIPNQPPVITETSPLLISVPMGAPYELTVHATDAESDPLSWSISTPPAHGSAVITSSNATTCVVSYTPAVGFVGDDSFGISASDGFQSTAIVVNPTVTNTPPVIAEGESYQLSALKNGGPRSGNFTATDANGNPLTWTISTPPAHGSAIVTSQSSSGCEITYTPDLDFSGQDAFVVEVSDGAATDTIAVSVTITDPAADPVLTVISPVGIATPPQGNHSNPVGTSLTPSASDVVTSTTRHLCVGWSMTGDAPASGTGNSFNFTLTRNSTLTWLWKTEHRVETAVTGNGSVSVNSGWQNASRPLQINAQPATGHYFTGWSGDTTGSMTGGNTIVLPMDRPYATITANFAPLENFSVVALPDTQNYTSISSPTDTFTRQTQWVRDNRETLNIRFLTHLGDIVNSPTATSQWTRATDAMNLLNNQLAYGTCPGNHDLGGNDQPGSATPSFYLSRFGPNPTHTSSVGRWVDPSTNQTYDWYRGSSPRGYSSYQIVPVNGRDFMFLHLDHDCPDEDMAWAASVLSAHPRTLTMIITHNYLAETGGSGFFGTGTGERGYTAQPNVSIGPDRNKPQEVFNALVKPFNQVYMVICGHMFAIYNLEKFNDAGNNVHEVVCDYQSLPNGGNGFLRIMEFRPSENRILNSTYSPTLGRYINPNLAADRQGMLDLHDPNGGEFELALDFEHRFDSTLTVASTYPNVSPAPGPHQIADGSPIVVSAEMQTFGSTRQRPIGWSLNGAQTLSGSGSAATFVHNGDSTLSWNWGTEHYLQTATVGDGIVSTASGWQAAGANVAIVAQPDPGAAFVAWTGDIAGCTIDGARITVPIDRPRGPVTATFSSASPTFAVTVVSTYSSTTPAAATYTHEQGESVTFSAEDLTESGTRQVCTGYTLSGGLTGSGSAKTVTLEVTGDFTLTWNWATEYRVLAASSGPGTVAPQETWIGVGNPLVLTGTPDSGAALTSWTGDTADGVPSGNTFSIGSINRPMGPITANFTVGMHTLTVISPENTVDPAPGTLVLPHGSVVSFAALPNVTGLSRKVPTGWIIDGPVPASGIIPEGSFILTGDTTLTWSWAPEVLLDIAAGLEGRVQPMDSAGWKPLGATINLTAVPAAGYHFVRWTGDVPTNSTAPVISLTMDQPRAIAADLTPTATAAGTPHWWLDANATVIGGDYVAAENADSDGDGQSARTEFLGGTTDRDPLRSFRIQSISPTAGPAFLLAWQSDVDRNYVIRSSHSPAGPFDTTHTTIAGSWPTSSASVPRGPELRRFFRIESSLAPGSALDADSPALIPTPAIGSLQREMRRVPAGWFTMGDDGGVQTSAPAHSAYIAGFEIDRFEVTRGDWETVVTWANAHGYDLPFTLPYDVPSNHPAVALSWYDAVKWCNARSEMEGRIPAYRTDATGTTIYRSGDIDLTAAHVNWSGNGYRLPTEAEWERASRGGLEGKPYPWGDANALLLANHWNYELEIGRAPSNDYPYTMAVGSFGQPATNAYGIEDMVGNAWEWTWDRMNAYTADSQISPRGPDSGDFRVLRGGAWWNYVDQATNSQRLSYPPVGDDDYGMLGFRCLRALHPNE
jgi:formylglycine-generating enzyme required for sulfatase activity